jgi:hypothetical protein
MEDEMLRFAQHDRMEDVAPSASEGSLGTCVPRKDKKKSVPRKDKKKSMPRKDKKKSMPGKTKRK